MCCFIACTNDLMDAHKGLLTRYKLIMSYCQMISVSNILKSETTSSHDANTCGIHAQSIKHQFVVVC